MWAELLICGNPDTTSAEEMDTNAMSTSVYIRHQLTTITTQARLHCLVGVVWLPVTLAEQWQVFDHTGKMNVADE